MNHLKVLCLSGLSGCLIGTLGSSWKHNFMQVNAQPSKLSSCDYDDELKTEHDSPAANKDEDTRHDAISISDSEYSEFDVSTGSYPSVFSTEDDSAKNEPPCSSFKYPTTPPVREPQLGIPMPEGIPGIAGWIHDPGSPEWVRAVQTPGGFEKMWVAFEDGGPIFPHPEIQNRHILEYKDFLLCHDNQTRTPCWTLENLTVEGLKTKGSGFYGFVRADSRLPDKFQANECDYAPVRNQFNREPIARIEYHLHTANDTYAFTNIAPMRLQSDAIKLKDEFFKYTYYLKMFANCYDVYILSGCLYSAAKDNSDGKMYRKYYVLGNSSVAVPTHFFKVVMAATHDQKGEKYIRLNCFKFENKKGNGSLDLRRYLVSKEELEKEVGFKLFGNVFRVNSAEVDPNYIEYRREGGNKDYGEC